MIDLDNKKNIWALSIIAVLGGMTFFQAGLLLSGNLGLIKQDSQKVVSKDKVRDKVKNYVSVTTGEQTSVSVTGVERSDKLESFYTVGIRLTAKVGNQTQTQETTALVSRDGEYILTGEINDIENPQPPRPRTPTVNPQTESSGGQ